MQGTGNIVSISTCNADTDFPTGLAVMSGCGGQCISDNPDFRVECPNPMGKTCTFDTRAGTSYSVFVYGEHPSKAGTVAISAKEFTPPPNDQCSAAESLTVDGKKKVGTTFGASPKTRCSGETLRGIFYAIAGTGKKIYVSTCEAETVVDAEIQVQTSCGATCNVDIATTNGCPANALATEVSFQSSPAFTYYIFVSGRDSSVMGNIGIHASETPQNPDESVTPASECKATKNCSTRLGNDGVKLHRTIFGRCFDSCTTVRLVDIRMGLGWKCGPCK
jgi:hypothetical protein